MYSLNKMNRDAKKRTKVYNNKNYLAFNRWTNREGWFELIDLREDFIYFKLPNDDTIYHIKTPQCMLGEQVIEQRIYYTSKKFTDKYGKELYKMVRKN